MHNELFGVSPPLVLDDFENCAFALWGGRLLKNCAQESIVPHTDEQISTGRIEDGVIRPRLFRWW